MSLTRLACIFVLLVGLVSAAPLMSVIPSIAPDPFGSLPTFNLYSHNAINALELFWPAYGTPGTPEYYQQVSTFVATDVIGTDFPSWRGLAPPPSGFDTQTGNMLMFGLVVYGFGSTFTLNDISYTDDFFGTSGPVRSLADVGFGDRIVGRDAFGNCYGYAPGCLSTGTASTQLAAVFFSGFGAQFYVANQADLVAAIGQINDASSPSATGTYTLTVGGQSYSESAEADMIPEPATFVIAGLGLLLFFARKRS